MCTCRYVLLQAVDRIGGTVIEGLLQLCIIDICHGDAVRVELLYDTEDTAAERTAADDHDIIDLLDLGT